MLEKIATYTDGAGRPHAVELVETAEGALVVDRGVRDVRVVCDLEPDEGRDQALAVLEAGGYLERAREAESALCRRPTKEELRSLAAAVRSARAKAGEPELARAA
jgi:hypothetical protein